MKACFGTHEKDGLDRDIQEVLPSAGDLEEQMSPVGPCREDQAPSVGQRRQIFFALPFKQSCA